LASAPWSFSKGLAFHNPSADPVNSSGPKLRLADNLVGPAHKEMSTHLKSLQEIERDHIIRVLGETNWRVDGAKGAAPRSRLSKLGIKKP